MQWFKVMNFNPHILRYRNDCREWKVFDWFIISGVSSLLLLLCTMSCISRTIKHLLFLFFKFGFKSLLNMSCNFMCAIQSFSQF